MSVIEVNPSAASKDVGPAARKKLSSLIKFYMSKPHPFTACVRDNTKRFGKEGAEKVCATLKDIGSGTTKWRKGGNKKAEWDYDAMADAMIEAASGDIDGLTMVIATATAIEELTESKPLLTTVHDVQIIKTGIEYPLSTGPCTFTADDLAAAVAAQDDPAIPQPRIWLGHPDDKRIHGERAFGPPSGEPAVGKVCDMRLIEDGHCIEGDLMGVPVWFANIMASAFPSRSIEGRFNVKTPTGKTHRLVISGLAMLGVVWPGVMTLEDIAALYTEKGPDVDVTEATADLPVAVIAAAQRKVAGQVNVEDLRRAWYEANRGDPEKYNWWIRSIYIDPNELIIDADDGGTLLRQPFSIKGDKIKFLKPKKVKIKYVNASHGGVEAEPINAERQHVAKFDQPEGVLTVPLTGNFIEIKLGGKK